MKRTKAAVVTAALLAGAATIAAATSASADFTPQTRDIVGVGSDTIQIAMNNAADGFRAGSVVNAGYNGLAGARLVSFNATNPSVPVGTEFAHDTITLKVGTTPITRPDGSGAGKGLLYGANNNTAVDFARASSALNATEASNGLVAYPFAMDELAVAVSAQGTNAPAAISVDQLVDIYSGAITNWNQIGGQNGAIVPMIPQAGSGTRSFFEGQLTAANGGTPVTYGSNVVTVQEHDPNALAGQPNAVAPFSIGRAGLANAQGIVHIETGTATDGNQSFYARRGVYNVVRTSDLSKAYVGSIFASDGFLCSSTATAAIQAGGLKQLAHPLDGGVCGVPQTAAGDITNFLTN